MTEGNGPDPPRSLWSGCYAVHLSPHPGCSTAPVRVISVPSPVWSPAVDLLFPPAPKPGQSLLQTMPLLCMSWDISPSATLGSFWAGSAKPLKHVGTAWEQTGNRNSGIYQIPLSLALPFWVFGFSAKLCHAVCSH